MKTSTQALLAQQGLLMTLTILNATSQGPGLQVGVEFFLHREHDVEAAAKPLLLRVGGKPASFPHAVASS